MVYVFQVGLMILKFKTTRDTIDKEGIHLPDDLGLVNVGSNVRSASLDELLQLINVLQKKVSVLTVMRQSKN
jgi:hypothetical protein